LKPSGSQHLVFIGETGGAFVECLFASAWAGLAFSPINYRLTPGEIRTVLSDLPPALIVADASLREKADKSARPGDVVIDSSHLGAFAVDMLDVDPNSVAVVLNTSGTSSKPKAVLLRHRQLLSYVIAATDLAAASPQEAALMAVPPYHIAGVASALTTTYAGRRAVHLPRFDAGEWLRLVEQEQITHAFVVPTMLERIVMELEGGQKRSMTSLAVMAYGGAKAAPSTILRALELLPETVGFVNAFGLTETSSTVSVLGPEDHRAALASSDPKVRARLVSAGRPVDGIEITIRAENGLSPPRGEAGEILIRGPQVSGEYSNHASRVDSDGWFRTGDLGYLDQDDYLFIVGRMDDMIIRGGENIAPDEIEEVLKTHPSVIDAAVVGLADREWGQRIAAALVLRPGYPFPADLKGWMRPLVASHKIPEICIQVETLPYTETGKLRRRMVGDYFARPTENHSGV
jgi:acyl-CoA synthetase (AMP-forming)/AMP-acid ligase II